jgi:hypothetical protein
MPGATTTTTYEQLARLIRRFLRIGTTSRSVLDHIPFTKVSKDGVRIRQDFYARERESPHAPLKARSLLDMLCLEATFGTATSIHTVHLVDTC